MWVLVLRMLGDDIPIGAFTSQSAATEAANALTEKQIDALLDRAWTFFNCSREPICLAVFQVPVEECGMSEFVVVRDLMRD